MAEANDMYEKISFDQPGQYFNVNMRLKVRRI